jgi:hypothetical protein
MKRALVLLALLLVSSTLASAQAPAAPVADPRSGGGNCPLPDLAGLAPGEVPAAALNAGLQVAFASSPAVPACPVVFHCNSIGACAAGGVCSATILGQCCGTGGVVICCATGNFVEVRCPCKCTGPLCAAQCIHSSEVAFNCA